jgi:hypothetical protein
MNAYHHHTEAVISIGWLVRCASLCLLIGAASVGYLFQKEALHHKAEVVEKLERELRLLQRANELKRQEYATLISPKNLEAEVERRKLDLVPPGPDHVLTLPMPAVELVRAKNDQSESRRRIPFTYSQLSSKQYTRRRYMP